MFFCTKPTIGLHCIHGLSSQMLANAGVFVPDSFDTLGALIGYASLPPSLPNPPPTPPPPPLNLFVLFSPS